MTDALPTELQTAYVLLSQLAALYEAATPRRMTSELAESWGQITDALIADVGELHLLWGIYAESGDAWTIRGTGRMPIKQILDVNHKRFARLHAALGSWSMFDAWVKALHLAEGRWQHIIQKLDRVGFDTKGVLRRLDEGAGKRRVALLALEAAINRHEAAVAKSYRPAS